MSRDSIADFALPNNHNHIPKRTSYLSDDDLLSKLRQIFIGQMRQTPRLEAMIGVGHAHSRGLLVVFRMRWVEPSSGRLLRLPSAGEE